MRTNIRSTLLQAAFASLALWPVTAFLLWSVHIRIERKYFAALLSASELDGEASLLNQLFLYRQDLLVMGALAPALLMLSFALLRDRRVLIVWFTLILTTQLLLYANLQSWGQTGQFLSYQALVNAVSFGISNPGFVGDYISLDGVLKLSALLAVSAGVLVLAALLKPSSVLVRFGGVAALAAMTAAVSLAAVGATSSIRHSPITRSFYLNALSAVSGSEARSSGQPVSVAELDGLFEDLAMSPRAEFRGNNFGVESGSNLILFVLETASIEFLDVRGDLPQHPALDALRGHLFVAKDHFATFPASAESNLSILTGVYPPRAMYDTCLVAQGVSAPAVPGLIRDLRAGGYRTALYAPFRSQVPGDKVVFERTGFDKVFYGNDHGGDGSADERAHRELITDLTRWSRDGQRFVIAFYPQMGHGPWDAATGDTIAERGAHVARLQLNWLGQQVELLQRTGQLGNTVIVIVGDHGVRTTSEDPQVRVGMIDHYSLHVPLLIYAPHADYSEVDADSPSSHVDIAAELGQLFGRASDEAGQGLSFSHPRRRARRQFFMAGWYYGADGYRDSTESAMYSSILDVAYRRPDRQVRFGSTDIVRDHGEVERIRELAQRMLDLQESWIRHRLCRRG